MDLNYSYSQYQKTQFSTADQGKLILMMYDGAIRFLEQARKSMAAKDISGKGQFIGKAQNIISELNGCLDLKKGSNLATSLETLYLYLNNQLSMANIKNSFEHLDNALGVLKELREGWQGIVKSTEHQVAVQDKGSVARSVSAAP